MSEDQLQSKTDFNPHYNRAKAILALSRLEKPVSKQNKIHFRDSIEWLITNETNKEILAWAYLIRGNVHSGLLSALTEPE